MILNLSRTGKLKTLVKLMIVTVFTLSLFAINHQQDVHTNAETTYGDGIVRTIQFGGQNLYLDKGRQNDAIAYSKDGSSTQNFYFEYHPDKKAYKIYSADNPDLIVAWNAYPYQELPQNVFFTNNGNLNEHFWVLEEDPSSNKCYLRNYAQGNQGYLTAKNVQGGMTALLSTKMNYKEHYTELTISPSLKNDTTLGNNYYRIVSAAETGKSLNRDVSPAGTAANVSIDNSNSTVRQKWWLSYSAEKDAYIIRNIDDSGTLLVLAWNSNVDDYVFGYGNTGADDQFWRLESVGNGNYIIKNYRNPNKVLDLKYLSATSIDVHINDRTNSITQQFKLQKY